VAETLKISHLLERKTAKLSGGEMQRVSIGRAIVRSPRVFLMDEPLSNLDAKMREVLRVELQHLQRQQGITTIFVTHDQIEALTLADRIGVLNKGRIIQIGTPVEIYDQPGTTFVAQLIGTPRITLAPAERENGTIRLTGSDITLPVPQELSTNLSRNFQFGIRAEDVRIDPQGEFEGQIFLTEPLGTITNIHIQSGSQKLISAQGGLSEFHIGEKVRYKINILKAHYFDPEGNRIRPA
jgi:multiple sugar transport system ATP-binding protein